MKEKTNIFNTFVRSIYDVSSFSVSARKGIKRAVMYMLLLTIILGGIKGIILGRNYYKQVSEISYILQQNDYNINIENNELNTDDSPIMFRGINKLTLYIDDEKTITDKLDYMDVAADDYTNLLILKDGIILENIDDKYIAKYSTFLNGKNISNNTLKLFIKKLKVIFPISYIVVNIFNMLINLLVDYLIIVTVASLISLFMKMIVRYGALWSLTIYASTLPLILVTVLEVIRPDVDFEVTFIIGTLTYLIIIFKNIKADIIEKFSRKSE